MGSTCLTIQSFGPVSRCSRRAQSKHLLRGDVILLCVMNCSSCTCGSTSTTKMHWMSRLECGTLTRKKVSRPFKRLECSRLFVPSSNTLRTPLYCSSSAVHLQMNCLSTLIVIVLGWPPKMHNDTLECNI